MRDEKLYNCLDDDGLPPPGTEIESGQAVIGRITCPREAEMLKQKGDLTAATMQVPNILSRDASLFHKKSNGVVDETIVFQNDQGGKTAKVRMRVQKIPELGDKFAVSIVRQT